MNKITKIKQIGTKTCSLFLALAMLCTMQSTTALAEKAKSDAIKELEGSAEEIGNKNIGDLLTGDAIHLLDSDLTIEQRRENAKKELTDYQASQKNLCSTYDIILWDWTVLTTGTEIDSAQNKENVQASMDNAKIQIDQIISGAYASTLKANGTYDTQVRTAKRNLALADLSEYEAKFNKNDYFQSDWESFESYVIAAHSNIDTIAKSSKLDTAAAIQQIDIIVVNAKKKLDEIPDKTDPAAIALENMKQELEKYKETKIAEINNNYTSKLGNYPNKMQYENLKKIIDDGIAEIKRVIIAEGENVASPGNLSTYTFRIDILVGRMKANLEDKMKLYDSANLVSAATKAKKELDSYKDPKNYRTAQKKELENAIAAGKTAISKAKTKEAIAEALQDAKAKIDKIKTDAQLKKEEADGKTTAAKVSPKKTSILGKIQAQKKGFTVKWKMPAEDVGGYEVSYSTNKKFTKKATVTKKVNKKTSTKLAVRKLKAKKKYYVRVRTYKTVNGKKYVSSWSPVKTVVTNK